jgi:ferrous-iron efflux pump FieF
MTAHDRGTTSEASPVTLERTAVLMRRATYASIAVAAVLILIKVAAWLATDSVSMLSSLLDSLLDGAASLVNLVAVQQAVAPADREHRFGHGKAEPLASLGQATFITGSAVFLLVQALHHLLHPVPVSNTGVGLAVMGIAVIATLALVRYQRRIVRETGSLLVMGDELHYRADLILNLSVVGALVGTELTGWPYIDPIAGAAIALWIVYGAWRVASQAIVQLMDRELPDDERRRIREIATAHPQVRSVHDLRTRAAGPTAFVEMHIEMDGEMTLNEAHVVSDAVESEIRAAFPRAEVMIHQDPAGIDEPRLSFPPAKA